MKYHYKIAVSNKPSSHITADFIFVECSQQLTLPNPRDKWRWISIRHAFHDGCLTSNNSDIFWLSNDDHVSRHRFKS